MEKNKIIADFIQESAKADKANKIKKYRILNQYARKGEILFVGSSLMEFFPINELLQGSGVDCIIYNRGVSGYTTSELLESMEECIFELEPSKIFINIGTNDIGSPDYKIENLISNYNRILTSIGERLPNCKVYVMAYYPVNAKADFPGMEGQKEIMFKTRTNPAINQANLENEKLAAQHGFEYINVNDGLFDEDGNLKAEYAIEGLHMWPNAYKVIFENIKKYLV